MLEGGVEPPSAAHKTAVLTVKLHEQKDTKAVLDIQKNHPMRALPTELTW